jgi:hypothetical protein
MFHMHTTFSDGLMTPEQLVDYYANLGYDVIGITDHDTMASFPRAKAEADKMNMILVPGEELTYNWSDGVTLKHVVALFINTTIPWNVNWMNNNLVTPLFDAIHLQGGIGVVAHPWDTAQSLAQWSAFMTPYYARYWIDGWEGWDKSFYLTSGGVYLRDIDFHGTPGEIAANTSASCYTLLMCQNRTLEGVREAFDARRMVIYDGGSYYGSPQALATFIATTDVTRLTL